MKPKHTVSSYVLLVGLMGLLIAGGVISYQIYSALLKSQMSKEQKIAIRPLEGSIDVKVLNDLNSRRGFSDIELDRKLPTNLEIESSSAAKIVAETETTPVASISGAAR